KAGEFRTFYCRFPIPGSQSTGKLMSMQTMVRRSPLVTFFILAFALTWILLPLLSVPRPSTVAAGG
ncbi:MAG: hypothetical protein ABI647_16550, partial [Gemmatimonadota bacterium]